MPISLYMPEETTMQQHTSLANVDEQKLRRYLNEVDGRTFWNPKRFVEMGFAREFVDGCTRDHVSSDDDPKNQIIDFGRLQEAVASAEITSKEAIEIMTNPDDLSFTKEHLVAVHDIEFLMHLALALGTPLSEKMGRGSRAHEMATGILQYLDFPRRTRRPAPRTRRIRDSQRSAVFNWGYQIEEHWPEANRKMTLDRCQELVNRVWSDYRPGEAPPVVRNGRGCSRARLMRTKWEIRLPLCARRPIHVLDLIAHSLEAFRPPHGPHFARLALEL